MNTQGQHPWTPTKQQVQATLLGQKDLAPPPVVDGQAPQISVQTHEQVLRQANATWQAQKDTENLSVINGWNF